MLSFYAVTVALTFKPRGVHYLWHSNLDALEFEQLFDGEKLSENEARSPSKQYIGRQQRRSLFNSYVSRKPIMIEMEEAIDSDLAALPRAHELRAEHDDEAMGDAAASPAVPLSIDPLPSPAVPLSNDPLPSTAAPRGRELQSPRSEFISLFHRVYRKRGLLREQRRGPMHCRMKLNYFASMLTLYQIFWILILPHIALANS